MTPAVSGRPMDAIPAGAVRLGRFRPRPDSAGLLSVAMEKSSLGVRGAVLRRVGFLPGRRQGAGEVRDAMDTSGRRSACIGSCCSTSLFASSVLSGGYSFRPVAGPATRLRTQKRQRSPVCVWGTCSRQLLAPCADPGVLAGASSPLRGPLWKTHHQLCRAAEPRIASITSVPGGPTKHPVVAARGHPGQLCSRTGYVTGAPCGVPWVVMSASNDAPLQAVSGE